MGKLDDKAKEAVRKAEARAARPKQELSVGTGGVGVGIGFKAGGGERESGGSGKGKPAPEPEKKQVQKKPKNQGKPYGMPEVKVKGGGREFVVHTPGFQTRGKKRTFVEGVDVYHDE